MEVDIHFASSIRSFLFGDPGNGGTDLTARNIQRGREHGIPDYNTCRSSSLMIYEHKIMVSAGKAWGLQRRPASQTLHLIPSLL